MLRCLILFAVLLALPVSSSAAAEPTLTLGGEWFQIVEPYRYVEARRFERGWNRGADVRVVDGRVRSPVAGTVRFAGTVVGRQVVTVATSIDGLATMLTITGLEHVSVRAGDRVDVGDAVGGGNFVHVGVYDRARRSHYLPVLGQRLAPARGSDDSISAAVARRLLDSIDGTARPSNVGVHSATDAGPGAAAVKIDNVTHPRLRTVASIGRPQRRPTHADRPSTVIARPHGGTGMTFDTVHGQPITRPRVASTFNRFVAVGASTLASAATESTAGGASTSGRPPRTYWGTAPREAPHRESPGSRALASPSAGGFGWAAAVESRVGGSAPSNHARHAARSHRIAALASCGLSLLSLLALPTLVRRRRRRGEPAAATNLAPPLPVHLPPAPARRAWRARTDGSSLLPDSALAWPDRDRGTSPRTDHTRERRAPEHA
jgi:hypothetical protein